MSRQLNQRLYDRIRAAADRGALHHALLLTGPKGSGKGELARFIAAAMECTAEQGKPCGACPACRKVFSGIHPDVITVHDDSHKTLPVETVREVCADAYIRPNEGQRKIYLFDDCTQLDSRCQDILLKTVEEGPRYAAFLFLSENAAAILPTIRSRCAALSLRGEADDGAGENASLTRALALTETLALGKEGPLAAHLCSLESAKLQRQDLTDLFADTREIVAAALLLQYGRESPEIYGETPKKLAKKLTNHQLNAIIEMLTRYHDESALPIGIGHALGALSAELSALLLRKTDVPIR